MKVIIPRGEKYEAWDTTLERWDTRWANTDREMIITSSKGDTYTGIRHIEDYIGGEEMVCSVPKSTVRAMDNGPKLYNKALPSI